VFDLPNALITSEMVANLAPMVSAVASFEVAVSGPAVLDMSGREGFCVLQLEADCTGLTIIGAGKPHIFLMMVVQGAAGGFSWTPPPNVLWSGGNPGVTATVPGHADIYTLSTADGTVWWESGRAMDVG
jgi:hypothetical protein